MEIKAPQRDTCLLTLKALRLAVAITARLTASFEVSLRSAVNLCVATKANVYMSGKAVIVTGALNRGI